MVSKEDFLVEDGRIYLVYQGLTRREKEGLQKQFEPRKGREDGFEYPRAPGKEFFYYDKKRQSAADAARKAARRAKYREERLKDLQQHIEDLDAVKEVCGLVFKKGEPTQVDLGELIAEERIKLLTMAQSGVFRVAKPKEPVSEPAPEPVAEEQPPKAEEASKRGPGRPSKDK